MHKILLIEDDIEIAAPLTELLAHKGYEIHHSTDGMNASALLEGIKPNVVLLDLALPQLDGQDVCQNIRAESEVPIIIVSARNTLKDRITSLNSGADDFVNKPFSTEELILRIQSVIRRSLR
ncbi:response regulator transcription factor [Pleionea sp. CnH1-48]|uniref:response regulator transcription factor n=1 Tax=Pleionea sp. CnH1-48 TaxID=2954494 RepID=UPI0020978F1A|nr:response regulator [Pleionea sp. CnH1-48]MCO7224248.1 response regulator [Pleionea sp. CnH1-48]